MGKRGEGDPLEPIATNKARKEGSESEARKLHPNLNAHLSASRLACQPIKRKFVQHTPLASPTSKLKGPRNNASHSFTTSPSSPILPSPLLSTPKPKLQIHFGPFVDDLGVVAVGVSSSANPTITGLAAYLTALSNDQVFRASMETFRQCAHRWT